MSISLDIESPGKYIPERFQKVELRREGPPWIGSHHPMEKDPSTSTGSPLLPNL